MNSTDSSKPAEDATGVGHSVRSAESGRSLYVHVPFCRHRCGYCNFTLVAGRDHLIEKYLDALQWEVSKSEPAKIKTVFLGGGTPTHLSVPQLKRLFSTIQSHFEFEDRCEFTVEGNPSDFNKELIELLASQGVNRVSLGVQSFQTNKLRFLERDHDREQVEQKCDLIRQYIPDFSIDLIFGSRMESLKEWHQDLECCIHCGPKHVSTYSLTIEKGTRFWNRQLQQEEMLVSEEQSVEYYEQGIHFLESHGFRHYEISNFAKPGFECLHNINYWNGGEYYGFGPGAARFINGVRATNHQSTSRYLKLVLDQMDPTFETEVLSEEQQARERLIFGMRQIEGVCLDSAKAGFSSKTWSQIASVVESFIEQKIMFVEEGRLKLTRSGLLVSDSIWHHFL